MSEIGNPLQPPREQGKIVQANQKAIDGLPLNSGHWSVLGVPGLYIRCRARAKSFYLQRRVQGHLVKETLGNLSMKRAREKALKSWAALKPKPRLEDVVTLEIAIKRYLEEKPLAPKTIEGYEYIRDRYLQDWNGRSLHDVGNDRVGFRYLIREVRRQYGPATSNGAIRLVSAVYRWQRKIDPSLPEPPTTAVEVDAIPPRDWAYTDEELRAWWSATKNDESGEVVKLGVSTLGPIKRMWWLAALFTGARKGSIEALRWADLEFGDQPIIRFRVTKGNRPYAVPMAAKLAELLQDYREREQAPPSEWVFPSNVLQGGHLKGVKNPVEGVGPAHRLRHTFRTVLAQLGASSDQARMLMGHSMGGDVSRDYITAPLVVESLRTAVNAVADHYLKILGLKTDVSTGFPHAKNTHA